MSRCAQSRSTLNLLLAGGLMLASAAQAFGQAGPSPVLFAPANAADAQATSPATQPAVPPSAPQPPSVPPSAAPTPLLNAPQESNAQNYTPPANTGTLFAYSLASVPDMIGDPGRGRYRVVIDSFVPATASLPIAAGAAYAKICDDNSPIPTDRVFSDYNYFNHAVQTVNGAIIGLNAYTIGVEKTFFCGWCSVEVEAPIDSGLNDTQYLNATTAENQGTVFGNMAVTFKCLVYKQECLAVSVGTMVDLPTAPKGVFNAFGETLTIDNNSVHAAPFVGFVYEPCCSNFFAVGFVQVDVDCNGDPVRSNVGYVGSDPRLRDPSLLEVDLSMGYWLMRQDQIGCRYLTGIAPTVELHYTTTLQDAHGVSDGLGDSITPLYGGTDCLDLTAGVHFQMGPCSMFTVAAAVPLRDSQRDRQFDSELLAQFDRRF